MNREVLLRSVLFDVVRLQFGEENGAPVTRDVIEHPGAAVILPILDDGRIVMIKNRRLTVGKTFLELPAGTLEPDEPPVDCAKRELEEETGFRCGRIEPLIQWFSSPGILTERKFGFVATQLTESRQSLDKTELIEVHPQPLAIIIECLRNGQIEDGKTLTMLLYWLQFQREEMRDA